MSSNRTAFFILCEDQKQRDFVNRYLRRLGHAAKDIHAQSVCTSGSGEQWVRRHYPEQVRKFRSRRKRMACALIVVTDADIGSLRQRCAQLEEALAADGLHTSADDPLPVMLIPKRNIQTWIEHLRVAPPALVTEEESYPEREAQARSEYWWPAVDKLIRLRQGPRPWPNCPPSLAAAQPELDCLPG